MENFSRLKSWLSPKPVLAKSWAPLMTIGVLYAAIGATTLIWSIAVFAFFIYLIGAVFIIFGLENLLSALKLKAGAWSIARSSLLLLIGIFIVLSPLLMMQFIGYVIGIWIILSAIDQIISATAAPDGAMGKMSLAVSGIVSLVFGIIVIIMPDITVKLFGIYMLCNGIFAIASANALRAATAARKAE